MKQNNIPENILSDALQFLDSGGSTSDVLKLYSEHKLELAEILKVVQMLQREKESIVPSKEFLHKIFMHLNFGESVTKQEASRYMYRGEETLASLVKTLSRSYNQIMNWKIGIPIGIVAIVIVFFIALSGGKPSIPSQIPTTITETPGISTGSPMLDSELNALIEAATSGDDLFEPVVDFGEVESDLDLVSI